MAISSNGLAGLKPGVVDSTATRPASPFEGQVIFQKDTDQLLVWNGTAWVIPNSPAQNPDGLELITTCTASFTGGTAGSVSNGVVTIGTNNTAVTVSNAFSSNYDVYQIYVSSGVLSANNTGFYMYLGTQTTEYSYGGWYGGNSGSGGIGSGATAINYFPFGEGDTNMLSGKVELVNPFLSKYTWLTSGVVYNQANQNSRHYSGMLKNTTSYTAFTMYPASGNITGGTIRVYGLRNS